MIRMRHRPVERTGGLVVRCRGFQVVDFPIPVAQDIIHAGCTAGGDHRVNCVSDLYGGQDPSNDEWVRDAWAGVSGDEVVDHHADAFAVHARAPQHTRRRVHQCVRTLTGDSHQRRRSQKNLRQVVILADGGPRPALLIRYHQRRTARLHEGRRKMVENVQEPVQRQDLLERNACPHRDSSCFIHQVRGVQFRGLRIGPCNFESPCLGQHRYAMFAAQALQICKIDRQQRTYLLTERLSVRLSAIHGRSRYLEERKSVAHCFSPSSCGRRWIYGD